jgi:hypothetical protein
MRTSARGTFEGVEAQDQPLPPFDETQLVALARLTPAERFRRAVISARNMAPFLQKAGGPFKAGPDELPG